MARIVALVLILLPIGTWFIVNTVARAGPSQEARDIASFNPRAIFSDTSLHFLPTPVAAFPAEVNTGPPAPAASEQSAAAPKEKVKVANTGGAGAILRADPPRGRQVTGLRDGSVLQVLEHRTLDDGADWLRVKTADGLEGWVFSRLVAAVE